MNIRIHCISFMEKLMEMKKIRAIVARPMVSIDHVSIGDRSATSACNQRPPILYTFLFRKTLDAPSITCSASEVVELHAGVDTLSGDRSISLNKDGGISTVVLLITLTEIVYKVI